ncbi:fumarate hydratase C-terminal domain-containing protein, partial [Klebsiella pneumoniae]|uniref:fumarate hydratase C-terminal domain-containing protein n=1 Tax=Klebsiella pneumoniae TaxID=573 RepID=UPI0031352669
RARGACDRTARGCPRREVITPAWHKHGGFCHGSIGGPAAELVQQSNKIIECVGYPELGMEAIWKIEVEDFPAFILVDDKGNDFFQQIQTSQCARCVK